MNAKQEISKAMKDCEKNEFGIFDMEHKVRIKPEALSFFWNCSCGKTRKPPKIRKEIELRANLNIIMKVYKEKFKGVSPYDLKLFKKDEGLFVERMIRAVEICTLKYVLNLDGTLNKNKHCSITKGRRRFLWEQ